jgi:hypothetical protein
MSKIALDEGTMPEIAARKQAASKMELAVGIAIAAIAVALAIAAGATVFPTEPDVPMPWEAWVRSTFLHRFVTDHVWMWPTLETLHYVGLSTLIGTVGLFDLRVLGMGTSIPPAALHRLIPIGIAAYGLNILTGICFLSAFPEQYFYNPSFWWKGLFMAVAGVNVAVFYLSTAYRDVKALPAGGEAPLQAKIMAGTSLTAWICVLICGRLLTFFRPPFFH